LSLIGLPFENLSGDKDQDYFANGNHRRSDDRPFDRFDGERSKPAICKSMSADAFAKDLRGCATSP
jgi:hypothetical protein